jgi:hypothetical protein
MTASAFVNSEAFPYAFQVLVHVTAANVKFDTEQTLRVLKKEEKKQTLVSY